MRGKKTNPEFLSDFIKSCVESGLETTEDMVTRAKKIVKDIDDEIKRVEKQKALRSEMIGVISALEKPTKTPKLEEIRALSFFKIQRPIICKSICDAIKKSPSTIDDLMGANSKEDIMYCIKQLLENKVIHKSNNLFLRGEMFDEYLKFVLKEK